MSIYQLIDIYFVDRASVGDRVSDLLLACVMEADDLDELQCHLAYAVDQLTVAKMEISEKCRYHTHPIHCITLPSQKKE